MDFLISFYDNFLIYYPNFFFVALFLICFLLVVLTIKVIRFGLRIRRGIKNIWKIRLRPVRMSNRPLVLALRLFKEMSKVLEYLQIQIEMILKKIGKEILIDE